MNLLVLAQLHELRHAEVQQRCRQACQPPRIGAYRNASSTWFNGFLPGEGGAGESVTKRRSGSSESGIGI